MSDLEERISSICQHRVSGTNCKKCGLYIHSSNPAIKTNFFNSYLNCSASKYLKHMRKRQCEIIDTKQISEATWNILHNICEKFEYTLETMALGLYIYAKTNPKQERDEKFWASATLLVASKAIELDRKVPYLNRYQKYAEKTYSQNQYETAEKSIVEQIHFDLQYTTFLSFINFYMTNGFLFQSDGLNLSNLKLIQDELIFKSKQFLKNASFLAFEPQKLALSLIKEVRVKHKLEAWLPELQKISGFKQQQIQSIQKNNILKPLCSLSVRAKQKLTHFSNHNTMTPMQSSLQLLDQKPKLIRRKNESIVKNNIKENTFRAQPQVHQILLSNIRKQNFSVCKYPSQGPSLNSSTSSQKLMPLFGFQNRRI